MKGIYETERLIIREWQDEDYMDLYEYASDENVTKFLSFPTYKSLDVAKERINSIKQQNIEGVGTAEYCIEHKETKKVIGSIGIVEYKAKNEGEVEIGYIINPKFQGQGFATECLVGMFKYIKKNKIAKRIVCKHDIENFKSGNVMKRAGMVYEGTLRKAGKNNYHSRYDIAQYSILDEEISID